MKTIIKKVIPINTLRKIKAFIYQYRINKIGKMNILPYEKGIYPFGINIIGPIKYDTGLGESCRLITREIRRAGIPYMIKEFSIGRDISSTNHEFRTEISNEIKYSINLIHINMHEFAYGIKKLGKSTLDRHYNIAFWLWEVEEFPKEWCPFFHVLDEIWTPSEFISNALRKVTDKPVITVPYNIQIYNKQKFDRIYYGLPKDKFLYLMMFDNNSIAERKNPMAAIEAFKKAFPNGNDDVGLVIKINNASNKELDKIKEQLKRYKVYFINRIMSREEVNGLIEIVDVYISLHRSEGFGLVLAEAMLQKTPTIATGYSGNTEFQNSNTACLVDYKLIHVGEGFWPYKKENIWADVNIEDASRFIRRLFIDKAYYERIRENAYISMNNLEKQREIQKIIIHRMDKIYG